MGMSTDETRHVLSPGSALNRQLPRRPRRRPVIVQILLWIDRQEP